MQKPTIHLNGSHGPTLLQDHIKCMEAIVKAQEALINIAPHGRDYYLGGSIQEAINEYAARYRKLEEVRKELEEIAVHIQDQIKP